MARFALKVALIGAALVLVHWSLSELAHNARLYERDLTPDVPNIQSGGDTNLTRARQQTGDLTQEEKDLLRNEPLPLHFKDIANSSKHRLPGDTSQRTANNDGLSIYVQSADLKDISKHQHKEYIKRNTEPVDESVKEMLDSRVAYYKDSGMDCDAFISGKDADVGKLANLTAVRKLRKRKRMDRLVGVLLKLDCKKLIKDFGYVNHHLTEEEKNFPIAFSIMLHSDLDLLTRLLPLIYRPQNIYCIHINMVAHTSLLRIMQRLQRCLNKDNNIIIPQNRVNWTIGAWSMVEAELTCMGELHSRAHPWQYMISLKAGEMPIKTNWEMVQMLKAMKGANDVDGSLFIRRPNRWGSSPPQAPPAGVTPVMGRARGLLHRDFVRWVLEDQMSLHLQAWLKKATYPEEMFFATINHNAHLGVNGSLKGLAEVENKYGRKPTFARYKLWHTDNCARHVYSGICVLTLGDLPSLTQSPAIFSLSWNLDIDPLAVTCVEEWLANKTRAIYTGDLGLDTWVYGTSVLVTHQLRTSAQKHSSAYA